MLNRPISLERWLLPPTILALPVVLGCSLYGETPPDELPVLTNSVQVGSQSAANGILISMFNLQDGVAGAFLRTANIKLDFHQTSTALDPTLSPNYPDWPDPDNLPDGLAFFQQFAAANHDAQHYPWVIFYVTHTVHNAPEPTICAYGGGFSYVPVDNNVTSDLSQRYSYLFVTDINNYEEHSYQDPNCAPPAAHTELENILIHDVVHEFGHERAGLTDNDGSNSYHQGSVKTGRLDVMSGEYDPEWRKHNDPVFDANGQEDEYGPITTCRGNLLRSRRVQVQ